MNGSRPLAEPAITTLTGILAVDLLQIEQRLTIDTTACCRRFGAQAGGALLRPRALAVKGNDGDFKGKH